jgi:hypothetical protein
MERQNLWCCILDDAFICDVPYDDTFIPFPRFGGSFKTPFKTSRVQSLSIEMNRNSFLRDARPITFTTTSSKILSILTIRTPLGPINGNITRGKELTPKLLNKICVLAENGHDIPFIMGRYKVSRGTVRYTLDH